jgi:filamentous hemagglutinin family protein
MYRPDTIVTPAGRRKIARLLAGCALATVLVALPRAAAAQSFKGTPDVVAGDAFVTTADNTTNVQVNLPETVINWYSFADVDPKAIDFQPGGTTANFIGARGLSDYTVLNRILPLNGNSEPTAATVAFNGTVNSTLFNTARGGNVWFYSPTGIIVGPKAAFNVGSLVLTTNDIQFVPAVPDVSNGSIYGPGGLVQFRGPADSKGFVTIQPGAQIKADGINSYVALVAPRVQQDGMVSANGSIAYVGAEQVDMTINAGLFDISILAGTTDPNGVVHHGTTTGPASTGGADQQQIMMVAMPKTTALMMLLSGSIGYTPAVSAFDDGSSVTLSAGYERPVPLDESAASLGDISIDNANFLNPVSAYSTGSIDIKGASGPVGFGSNAYLFAQDAINIMLGAGESLSTGDYLLLNAARRGQGGTIDIELAPTAKFNVGSYVNLNASSNSVPYDAPTPIDANGGTVMVDVDGGTLTANGGIAADVSAFGGFDPVRGGTGTAGSVSLTARNGGQISATSFVANLDGVGGSSLDTGGDAFGGTASLASHNGVLDIGSVYLEAYGSAGDGTAVSGAAVGGKASILLEGGTYNWDYISAYTDATAGFRSGSQGAGATGRSDAISLALSSGAALTVAGDIDLSANAYGTFDAPAGTNVVGGGIGVSVTGGSSLGFANLTANAQAGLSTPLFVFGSAPAETPNVVGGSISLLADGGDVVGQSISLKADAAELAATDSAGFAQGGKVDAEISNGGSLTLFSGEGGGGFTLSANGYGAVGRSAANAFGGTATLKVSGGSVNVNGPVNVSAGAFANDIALIYP